MNEFYENDEMNKINEDIQNNQGSQNNEDIQNNEMNGQENQPNYTFWAEEAAVSQEKKVEEGPKYQAATYSYKKEDLVDENRYYYNSDNKKENKEKKDKKTGGFWKKAGKLVASAAVFGLVAGVVFQGVNYTAQRLFPQETVVNASTLPMENEAYKIPATTVSEGISTPTDLTALVENTMPSIVSITSMVNQQINYFGQQYTEQLGGQGSGIIVGKNDEELLIATNNHVVADVEEISVTFINDTSYQAVVKGTDETADLAVIAVSLSDLDDETLEAIKIATLGDSDNVKVGQMAIAIGNALGSGQSVTVGYISAKNRQVNASGSSRGSQLELLQTDAAINPGNSGGALLNIHGEVIGINDMKYADTDVEGMGYAIPISEAIPIINELMNREILEEHEKGYLGITGNNITEENNFYDMPIGVYVHEVAEGGAAAEAGIRKGDIIVKINGQKTTSMTAVQEKVNNTRVGTQITVTIMRNLEGEYEEVELEVTLKGASSLGKLKDSASGNAGNSSNGKEEPADPGQNNYESYQGDYEDFFEYFMNQFN